MKKFIVFLLTLGIFFFLTNTNIKAEVNLASNSKSAILIEATTKRIIFEKQANLPLAPASMTKIMTLILVFEDLEKGKIKMDDMVVTPEAAKEIGESRIYLDTGEEMSVKDLVKSVAIASANDAAYSLAFYVSGSEAAFVTRMNEKAKAIGCKNTNFMNCHGLDDPKHLTSAYDIAIMSAYLINKYPEVLNYTSMYEGYDTINLRSQDIVGLLNYATSNYDVSSYLKKGDIVTTLEDVLIQPSKYNVVVTEDINILKKKGDTIGNVTVDVKIDNLRIKKLENVVGTMDVYYEGKLYKTVDLQLLESTHRSSFFDVCMEVLKELFLVS